MQIPDLLSLVRTRHLIKNVLVFAPLIFSLQVTAENVSRSFAAFFAFSLTASAVYIFNDIQDVDSDRKHPKKKFRPIASGRVSIVQAIAVLFVLLLLGFLVAMSLSIGTFLTLTGYFLLNLLYSSGLKTVSILDVMIVASGFVLRILAGGLSIDVPVSPWILLCTFFGALFLAFGKRKGEIDTLKEASKDIRNVLLSYNTDFLNQLIGTTAATTVITYSLYTIDEHTIDRLGTAHLIYTVPFVVFGIFRYFQIIYTHSAGDDPTKVFSTDRPILVNMVLWGITFGAIVYLHV